MISFFIFWPNVNFLDSSFLLATAVDPAVEDSVAALPAANSVKLALSSASVLGIMVAPVLGDCSCSSDFFNSATVGFVEVDFCPSLGSGFLASSILKPGGSPLSEP